MSVDRSSSPERLIATLVSLPLGIGALLVDELPSSFVKARRQVELARFVGKMAVDQGAREIRRRLDAAVDAESTNGADGAEPSELTMPSASAPTSSAETSVPASESSTTPDAEALALPDYDQLPAAHIVSKLAGLTQRERDDIEAHELAHRHRRTVLGKLAQLRGT